jgi:hypothetical protein
VTAYLAAVAQTYLVSRRSTPERMEAARHAAVRNSLIGDGVSPETADAWITAWEAKAARDGTERGSACWHSGWDWIAQQRTRWVRP